MEWVERMRFGAVFAYTVGCFGLLMALNLVLVVQKHETLFGSCNLRLIPRGLRWLPFVGAASLVFMLGYCVSFLFFPRIVEVMVRIPFLSFVPVEVAGAALMVAGSVVITAGMIQLGPSARFFFPRQKTKLVTAGLFALSRNPVYLGLTASLLGVLFLLPSVGFLLALSFFVVTNHYRVLEEEQFLRKTFGGAYEGYCRRVGRYGPKLKP